MMLLFVHLPTVPKAEIYSCYILQHYAPFNFSILAQKCKFNKKLLRIISVEHKNDVTFLMYIYIYLLANMTLFKIDSIF